MEVFSPINQYKMLFSMVTFQYAFSYCKPELHIKMSIALIYGCKKSSMQENQKNNDGSVLNKLKWLIKDSIKVDLKTTN